MTTLEEQSTLNVGWYHLASLKNINEYGRWPGELSEQECKLLKKIGLVELKYTTHSRGGRQPLLTDIAKKIILAISPTGNK